MIGYLGMGCKKVRGSSLVEFALVMPMLALVLFGIIQYGFIFAAYVTVRNASAIGAREAVISTNAATAVAKAALGPMLNPNLGTATFSVTNISGASAYSVKVTYPLPLILPFVVPGGGSTKTLSATTIMR